MCEVLYQTVTTLKSFISICQAISLQQTLFLCSNKNVGTFICLYDYDPMRSHTGGCTIIIFTYGSQHPNLVIYLLFQDDLCTQPLSVVLVLVMEPQFSFEVVIVVVANP